MEGDFEGRIVWCAINESVTNMHAMNDVLVYLLCGVYLCTYDILGRWAYDSTAAAGAADVCVGAKARCRRLAAQSVVRHSSGRGGVHVAQ